MPAPSVRTTLSEDSTTVSSIGVIVTVAVVTPAASVSCRPFAESVPPVTVTV